MKNNRKNTRILTWRLNLRAPLRFRCKHAREHHRLLASSFLLSFSLFFSLFLSFLLCSVSVPPPVPLKTLGEGGFIIEALLGRKSPLSAGDCVTQRPTAWHMGPLRDALGVGLGSRLGLLCSLLQFLSNCGPFAPCTCKMHKIGEVTKNNVFPNYYATWPMNLSGNEMQIL